MGKIRDGERRAALKYQFAADLRANMTDAERRLWAILRSKQMGGLRFRRQQPIGPYIVDFFCPAAKLIIELDGDQHGTDAGVVYDEARTKWLELRGYRVLRFANAYAFKDHQKIVDAIGHYLADHELPSPRGRVEKCEGALAQASGG